MDRFCRPIRVSVTAFALWLSGCLGAAAQEAPKADLQTMIGQMLIVGFAGSTPDGGDVPDLTYQIKKGIIGGVILLKRNIKSPEQLAVLTQHLQDAAGPVPLFIGIDQEGGQVQRLTSETGFAEWASAAEIARREVREEGYALNYYTERGAQLRALHINLNFGPVVDLNVNPANPIIGALDRSYSADPAVVAADGGAFVQGHQRNGVLTAIKHFPGHGSSLTDSHDSLPDVSETWSREELAPYGDLAAAGLVDMAMVGHLMLPEFSDGPGVPVSLSASGVSALRELVGDETVIITDDMQMGAIQERYGEEEAAILAILAGNDVLIHSTFERIDPAIGPRLNIAIQKAVAGGRIPVSRIEDAYSRIVALKSRIGR